MKLNCNWHSTGEAIYRANTSPWCAGVYGYFLELLTYHYKSVQKQYLLKSKFYLFMKYCSQRTTKQMPFEVLRDWSHYKILLAEIHSINFVDRVDL